MKIFINTDLEGIAGLVNIEEFDMPTGRGVLYSKQQLTNEINAAVTGVLSVIPDTEFLVLDGHGGGYLGPNILVENLHPAARIIHGKRQKEIVGLDDSFDLYFHIGAHSMAGTKYGVMSHTISSTDIYNVFYNGLKIGEIGIAALLAGDCKVPLGLLSGDHWAVKETEELMKYTNGGMPELVSVKKGINLHTADCINPVSACGMIEKAARKAVLNKSLLNPLSPESITTVKGDHQLRIDFFRTDSADKAESKGAERIDGRSVIFFGDGFTDVLNKFYV